MENKKRLATLVGCNYANTRNELRGCINDVQAMRDLLVDQLGFDISDIVILTDEPGATVLPTGANIRQALRCMIEQARSGDIVFFHYSGHGTLIPSAKPHHDRQPRHGRQPRRDEAIVPCDFNLITDVDFRDLVDRLPNDATFTMISDSCHSGGLIQNEKEQIGPSTSPTSNKRHLPHQRPKSIPFDSVLHHLSSISGLTSPNVGDHLSALFGSDASPMFFPDTTLLHRSYVDDDDDNDGGILLSGCQTDETSADMSPDEVEETEGKAYGAFSNAIEMVMKRKEKEMKISYRDVVMKVRELLKEQGFQQHPCLYCSDENAEKPFLMVDEIQKEIDACSLSSWNSSEEC